MKRGHCSLHQGTALDCSFAAVAWPAEAHDAMSDSRCELLQYARSTQLELKLQSRPVQPQAEPKQCQNLLPEVQSMSRQRMSRLILALMPRRAVVRICSTHYINGMACDTGKWLTRCATLGNSPLPSLVDLDMHTSSPSRPQSPPTSRFQSKLARKVCARHKQHCRDVPPMLVLLLMSQLPTNMTTTSHSGHL